MASCNSLDERWRGLMYRQGDKDVQQRKYKRERETYESSRQDFVTSGM